MISSARSARRPLVVAAALALAFATPVLSGQSGDDKLIGGNGSDDADGEGGFDTCVAETEDQCEA